MTDVRVSQFSRHPKKRDRHQPLSVKKAATCEAVIPNECTRVRPPVTRHAGDRGTSPGTPRDATSKCEDGEVSRQ